MTDANIQMTDTPSQEKRVSQFKEFLRPLVTAARDDPTALGMSSDPHEAEKALESMAIAAAKSPEVRAAVQTGNGLTYAALMAIVLAAFAFIEWAVNLNGLDTGSLTIGGTLLYALGKESVVVFKRWWPGIEAFFAQPPGGNQ